MKHPENKKRLIYLLFITIFGLMVIMSSCSDDDDDNNDPPPDSSLTYTGSTSQVTISQANGEEVATSAYEGVVIVGQSTDVSDDLSGLTGGVFRKAAALFTKSRDGLCGGTRTLTITQYVPTVSAAGTLVFDEYCNYDVIIDGSVSASITFEASTTDFSLSSDQILLKDSTEGYVYQITNFILDVSYGSTQVEASFSGNFYLPLLGYVGVETTDGNPFVYESGNDYPSSGQMVITGASNVSARLTAVSETTYRVEVDLNGNGTYDDVTDYDSGTLSWDDI